jgi:hypothetical protein
MTEKRITYRRYEDRRVAMMLAIHEILFDEPPSPKRDTLVLNAIQHNYLVDRVAFIAIETPSSAGVVAARVGDWQVGAGNITPRGIGFERLLDLHAAVEGALTFESVRKPEIFSAAAWESLWQEGVSTPSKALLSVMVSPRTASPTLLWLQQAQSSREWNSRDRELAEEIAALLTKAREKGR